MNLIRKNTQLPTIVKAKIVGLQNLYKEKANSVGVDMQFTEEKIVLTYQFRQRLTIKKRTITSALQLKRKELLLTYILDKPALVQKHEFLPFTLIAEYTVDYAKICGCDKVDLYLNSLKKKDPVTRNRIHFADTFEKERLEVIRSCGFEYNSKKTEKISKKKTYSLHNAYFSLDNIAPSSTSEIGKQVHLFFESTKSLHKRNIDDTHFACLPAVYLKGTSEKEPLLASYYIDYLEFKGNVSLIHVEEEKFRVEIQRKGERSSFILEKSAYPYHQVNEAVSDIFEFIEVHSQGTSPTNEQAIEESREELDLLITSLGFSFSQEKVAALYGAFDQSGISKDQVESISSSLNTTSSRLLLAHKDIAKLNLFKNVVAIRFEKVYLLLLQRGDSPLTECHLFSDSQDVQNYLVNICAYEIHGRISKIT